MDELRIKNWAAYWGFRKWNGKSQYEWLRRRQI